MHVPVCSAPVVLLSLLLVGCATTPAGEGTQRGGPYPEELAASPRSVPQGQPLHWGGSIVSVRNEAERTVVEVLSYPLDADGRPDLAARPRGRFLVDHAGFLEPNEYRSGRPLSVRGRLLGYQDGEVGGAPYRYPAVSGDQLKLWSIPAPGRTPRVGVGVSGGSHGGGVGISIGF